jgi:FdhE protein
MRTSKWDARIRRAHELASTYFFAAEGLLFYERITQFQKSLYSDIEPQSVSNPAIESLVPSSTLSRPELDFIFLLPRFRALLSLIEGNGPAPLASSASGLRTQGAQRWQHVLAEFWQTGPSVPDDLSTAESLMAWIFLQPYAEYLADHSPRIPPGAAPSTCPFCGSKPQVGALRQEGDGGKRFLICALCGTDWEYRRIVCPACGEEDPRKLAVYTADEFKHVRVEACDTCHSYIKTVDLTKDARAVPAVDELATIPLNLWAAEHGYGKSQTNLLGI